jgi:hypothetical protein
MKTRNVLTALGAAACAALFVTCAGVGTLLFLAGEPGALRLLPAAGRPPDDPPPGNKDLDPPPGNRRPGLGPAAPFDHAGEPRGVVEEYVAHWVRFSHADMRMKREVEFLAWGPHDPKGETVNVRKDDRQAVFRVRYRFQREGQPLTECDELFVLKPDEIRRYDAAVKAERAAADWDGWSHILPPPPPMPAGRAGGRGNLRLDNPDGGAWLAKALAAKRAREAR